MMEYLCEAILRPQVTFTISQTPVACQRQEQRLIDFWDHGLFRCLPK